MTDISIIKGKLKRGDYAVIAELSNCSIWYVKHLMNGRRRIVNTETVNRVLHVSNELINQRAILAKQIVITKTPDQVN